MGARLNSRIIWFFCGHTTNRGSLMFPWYHFGFINIAPLLKHYWRITEDEFLYYWKRCTITDNKGTLSWDGHKKERKGKKGEIKFKSFLTGMFLCQTVQYMYYYTENNRKSIKMACNSVGPALSLILTGNFQCLIQILHFSCRFLYFVG